MSKKHEVGVPKKKKPEVLHIKLKLFLQSAQPDGVLPHLRIQYHGLRFTFLFHGFVKQRFRYAASSQRDVQSLRLLGLYLCQP